MAVLPMKKIHLVAMKRDRKKILEFLQRCNAVELTAPKRADNNVFSQVDCSQKAQEYAKKLTVVEKSLGILAKHSTEKKSMLAFLEGRQTKTVEEYEAFDQEMETVFHYAEELCRLETLLNDCSSNIIRWKAQEEELAPWLELTVPLDYAGTKHTCAFVGALSGEQTHQEIVEHLAKEAPTLEELHVEVISTSKEQTCIIAYTLKEKRDELKKALDLLDFSYPALRVGQVPQAYVNDLIQKQIDAENTIASTKEEIQSYQAHAEDLNFLSDYLRIKQEKNEAASSLTQSRHTFALEGYITEKDSKPLEAQLTKDFDCIIAFTDPEEVAPVVLKNSWFSEPTESVLASFSYPGPKELDPTTIMSVFYYLMFGLMFSDAGYGLLLVVVCGGLLLKFRNMETSMNRSLRMFFWCGVSTLFWGLMFGTFFGDVVSAVSRTFMGHEVILKPIWFDPVSNPMKLLMFSMGLGVIHLTTGYIMNALTSAKNKDYSAIIYDAVFPVGFIFSILLAFSTTDIFENLAGFSTSFSSGFVQVCLIIAAVCCVGVILFGGRESKGAKRILKGCYGLYNMVSGWLSDILSYSRLLALGLATGIIGSVINILGGLAGGGIVGAIVFLLAFVLGHLLNFGINILGAYVHSNRLEYVEFFGKFYEGGGRKFNPLGIHTKHYKIREELSNE